VEAAVLYVTAARERIAIGNTDNFDTVLAMRCEVIALDGIFDTGLSTVLDVFTTANELIGLFDLGIPPFDVSVVGVRRRVRTAQGLSVPLTIRTAGAPADWVVVPALGFRTPETLEPVLARPDVRAASALLPWEVYLTDEVNARLDGLLANAPDSHLRTGRAHSSSRLRRRELDDHDGVTVGTPAAH
jgi:hypothetical protein